MRSFAVTQLYLLALCFRSSCAQDTNTTLIVSEDGNCGGTTGQTCFGSSFGNCCSGKGYCGATSDYCNAECQSDFGQCVTNASSISSDGRCGTTDPSSQLCLGSSFGSCCSETGWCGSTDVYCGTGCQGDFGECNGTSTIVVPSSSHTSSLSTSSSSTSSSTSSTTPNPTGTAIPAVETQRASTMSTGAKAGVGIGVAGAGVAAIGAIIFFLRRRKARKQISELHEKVETGSSSHIRDVSSDTSKSGFDNKDVYVNEKGLPPMPMPAELGNQRNSRAELGGDMHVPAVELDSKSGSSEAIELPTSKN